MSIQLNRAASALLMVCYCDCALAEESIEEATGSAEVGPAKAAKQSIDFSQFLDREEVLGGKFTTWLELASDYVFRGTSETNDGAIPSIKGAITWTHTSGIFLGYYGANNLFPGNGPSGHNPKINALWGPFAGYGAKNLWDTGWSYNGLLFQYIYPGSRDNNYLEMFNYVDRQVGKLNIKFEYTPTLTDWFGVKDLHSHHVAAHPSYQLPYGMTLSASLGYQFFNNGGPRIDSNNNGKQELNWWHWNIGLARKIFGYTVDLRYHDTDIKRGAHDFYGSDLKYKTVNGRLVIAVSKTF